MKLLAVETATDACSVGLLLDGMLHIRHQVIPRQHTKNLLPMVETLLREAGVALAEMDAFVYGAGPGSFTGIRLAASLVQAFAFACDCPVVRVSTMQALAQGVYREHGHQHVATAWDARMGEVYWGCYQLVDNETMQGVVAEQIVAPQATVLPQHGVWVGAGNGFALHSEILQQQLGFSQCYGEIYPHVQDILAIAAGKYRCGELIAPEQALPTYLRETVAQAL